MKRLVASSLVILGAAASPVTADELTRKTELVDVDGASVDRLQLRYNFYAGWVIDNQNLLYRDTHQDHYLVTLKEACKQIDVRSRRFKFFPSWSWELVATKTYEIKPAAGQECAVGKIARLDETRANTLRDKAERRIW
ncbi:MAG TPA: hypothetical protein VFV70_14430 [Hyphomonadaceae bacterium]|nr:hypothetical protein [Hyphomonadaceae bacterium]